MNDVILKELFEHRLEHAKEELQAGKILYKSNLFKSANSILYNSPIDFKRHKDVIAYFNKNYIHTEIFPKHMGRRISDASRIREDSDYDDEFIVKPEDTLAQIETAEEMIKVTEEYINKK